VTAVPLRCHYCPNEAAATEPGTVLAMVGCYEQASGAGWTFYACLPCRKAHGLTPWSGDRHVIPGGPQ
jgi:hypothetical protein